MAGTTAIPADGAWRHAAVTYDGTTWRVYLNGVLETTLNVGNFTPRFDSIQHAALGTALNSTGIVTAGQTQGSFDGVIVDEARIWNYARSTQQIGHGRMLEIPTPTPGLLARWGANEGTGTAVGDSSASHVNGTINGTNFSWVDGAPFRGPGNTNPTASDDSAVATEDASATINVLGNDIDLDGDSPLSLVSVGAPAHGAAAVNADGTVKYTPAPNYNGADSFTYTISDGQGGSATGNVNVTVTGVNDAPVAANDAYSTIEDTPLIVAAPGVLANDTDVDGDALTTALVSGPSHGTLTLYADGGFVYTPAVDYNGPDGFTYKAADASSSSNIATVSIDVIAANDAPIGRSDSYSLDEDTSLSVAAPGVLSNDSDAEGDSLTASPVTAPGHGTLTLNADGSFIYTPSANFNGSDSFTYTANDGIADSAPVTVTLTVNAVNDLPIAANDAVTTDEDVAAIIHVLDNDSDVDGDVLTISSITSPSHGTAAVNDDGTITYLPAANYNGLDGFSYTISDGHGGSASASVAIIVSPVNDAPVAVDDLATTAEDTPVVIQVLANDLDIDGDALVIAAITLPGHGSAVLSSNGTITYTPAANFNGSDSFSYTVSDGHGGLATAVVTVTVTAVNDAPVAADDSYTTNEDTALNVAAPGLLGNDHDADGDSLTAILVSSPSSGTLLLNPDGSFTYAPAANFNGSDSFTYKISDGTVESAPATVTIAITAVNDAPLAINDSYGINEDGQLTVGAPGVLGNDTDTEAGTLTATLVSGPASGTLKFNPDGSFSYQPGVDFSGTDSFIYMANDGSADSAPATVTIVVAPVNDVPVGVEDHYGLNEDGVLAIVAPGVLINDLDADTPASLLSAVLVSQPSHGALTLNLDGSFTYTPETDFNGTDSFVYKVSDGAAESAPTTVDITVNAVNDAPVAMNDNYAGTEDAVIAVLAPGVLANDTDSEHDALTAILVSGPIHGALTLNSDGSFNYVPSTNYNGADTFTYKTSDGTLESNVATVTITIGGVNDPPVTTDDNYATKESTTLTVGSPGVLGNDTDLDGNALTAVRVSGPSHGTLALNPDGSFSYTPAANYSGVDSFTYLANDGIADSNVATVSIAVAMVNAAPVAVANSYSTNEDAALTVGAPGVLGNDTDREGDPLRAILVSGPSHGTLAFNADGSFTYAPAADYNGLDSFTYKANDGSLESNVAIVSITVNAVNDPPVAANDSYTTNEDTALSVARPGVLGNDTDSDSPTLTAIKVSDPAHGTLTLNPDGSFIYTPAANYNGPDSFTYGASDGLASSNVATVTINVIAVNDAPVAADNSYSKNEDVTLTVAAPGVLGNDTDVEHDALTAILVTGPSHGTLLLNPNGSFTYVSATNYNGVDAFTYKAHDGQADSNVATVTITINAVNDAPVAANDSYSTSEDTLLTVAAPGVLANDTDVDSAVLTAVKYSNPSHGTVTLNPNGSFVYTPAANYNGPDSFSYRARDGVTGSNTATVTIMVTAVNDAPVANNQSRSMSEDGTKAITLTATDVDGDALTFTIVTGPAHGVLSGVPPSLSYAGGQLQRAGQLHVQGERRPADSNVATVSLTINAVNDAPVATAASYTTRVNTPISGQLLATDVVEGSPLTYFVSSQPTKGTVFVNPTTGAFTYVPYPGRTGSDSFRFKANDGTANSNAARIDIRIQ